MEEINFIIANNLKAIRESKKLSLEKGCRIDWSKQNDDRTNRKGGSSPTITTIWKIANGLKISFSSLINSPQPDTKIVLKSEIQSLSEDNGKYRVYPHFPFEDEKRFEVYSVEIEKGGFLSSDSHRKRNRRVHNCF